MEYDQDQCDAVLEWLARRHSIDHGTLAPRALLEHIQRCEICRARLYVTLRAFGFERLPVPPTECAPCRADLPAFVEAERRDPDRALRRYPYVREHLWTCAVCLEAYDYLCAVVAAPPFDLLAAVGAGSAAALQPPAAAPAASDLPAGTIHMMRLPQRLFLKALPTAAQRGAALRSGGRSAESTYEIMRGVPCLGGQATCDIVAHLRAAGDWLIDVTLNPPRPGVITLTIGGHAMTGQVDAGGKASFAVPGDLFSTPDDVDIVMAIRSA